MISRYSAWPSDLHIPDFPGLRTYSCSRRRSVQNTTATCAATKIGAQCSCCCCCFCCRSDSPSLHTCSCHHSEQDWATNDGHSRSGGLEPPQLCNIRLALLLMRLKLLVCYLSFTIHPTITQQQHMLLQHRRSESCIDLNIHVAETYQESALFSCMRRRRRPGNGHAGQYVQK